MKPVCGMDTECFPNYWLCKFKNLETGKTKDFELYEGHPLDVDGLKTVLMKYTVITFNGINYDFPMIAYALSGATNEQLKSANDRIIVFGIKSWQFYDEFDLKPFAFINDSRFDQIDLIEVAPGVADSLKIYGGRLHTKKMQDLPYDPSDVLTLDQMRPVAEYCGNDIQITLELYAALKRPIELRVKMSEKYGLDLRSKSDAQCAEAVICSEIQKVMDGPVKRPQFRAGMKFVYSAPQFISFQTEKLNTVLQRVLNSTFVTQPNGTLTGLDPELSDKTISICGKEYQLGMGGLHSCESNTSHKTDLDTILVDRDVRSYYPSIILNCGLFPPHLTELFLKIFKIFVVARLKTKDEGNVDDAESLKVLINGTFGKTNSKYSKLYAPKMMLQITLTGQLASLMLIEALELAHIPVVSANTDGVVIACPRLFRDKMLEIVSVWEKQTGFETEETPYLMLHTRDVNNYFAVKMNGKIKKIGIFRDYGLVEGSEVDLKHSPLNEICGESVIAYLRDDVPLEETISKATDIRKFVTVRKVNGGALKDGCYVGKAIRFYHSTSTGTAIHYKTTGNMVPDSQGAMPLMQLPDVFPTDVDYDWYIRKAQDILAGIGVSQQQLNFPLYFDEKLLELQ
jgi:hypothetical protein